MTRAFVGALTTLAFLLQSSPSQAAWTNTATPGTLASVRSYPLGTSGLRIQLTLNGASHTCGTESTTLYFDSDKIGLDAAKAALATALAALTSGNSIVATYDCSYGGGYGWGVGLEVIAG